MIACRISRERRGGGSIDAIARVEPTECERANAPSMREMIRGIFSRSIRVVVEAVVTYDAASHRIETRRFVREIRIRIGWMMMCGCCRVFCFVSTSSIFFCVCGIFLDVDE